MVEGDKYLYIHIPKCAGKHIQSLLINHFSGKFIPSKIHQNVIPKSAKNKYKFTGIRNPWSWYVSLFEYTKYWLHTNKRYTREWKRKEINLIKYNMHMDTKILFRKWYKIAKKDAIAMNKKWYNSTNKKDTHELYKEKKGLYTTMYLFRLGNNEINDFYRLENLEEDITRILEKCGEKIDLKRKIIIEGGKRSKINKGCYSEDYRDYYTDSMINDVYKRDSYIIKKYDYTFD